MCRTRHIQRAVCRSAINDYLDSFLAGTDLDSKSSETLKKLKDLKDRVLRMRARGGLVVVTNPEKDMLLTTYALNSYRRQ